MRIKKMTDFIGESSTDESSIESLKDALVTITDDYKVTFSRDKYHSQYYIVGIRGNSQMNASFYNRRDLGGSERLSLKNIQEYSEGMKKSAKVLDLFLEALNRSGVHHNTIRIEIEPMVINIYISFQ